MADSLHCVADVRQFAKSGQLLNALEEVDPLIRDTANFISQYSSYSLASGWNNSLPTYDTDPRILERAVSLNFSDETSNELKSLIQRFTSFKHRFDRGVAAQAGLTIEEIKAQLNLILDDSGAHILLVQQQSTNI